MVIAEEFSDWDTSNRRIDLLCIDKEANLVVVELKRTEDGGQMDLQSIRYSAMISTMTFEQAVKAHKSYLEGLGREEDAQQRIFNFPRMGRLETRLFRQRRKNNSSFAEFSREVTTSVLWLNDKEIDIRCVKIAPYSYGDQVLLDVQQVIPLPEAEDFQVRVREKKPER